jgi:hypothetical protein
MSAARRRFRLDFEWERVEERTLLSIFTVTNTADNGDNVNPVPSSLRAAIIAADTDTDPAGANVNFSIPTTDTGYSAATQSWTITPTTLLPPLSKTMAIDGTSQPGFAAAGHPVIVLSGLSEPSGSDGLDVSANRITINSLVINGFSGGNALDVGSSNNTIVGNFIGTDPTGTTAVGNNIGVAQFGCGGDTIGGTTPAARNVISGNAYGIYNSNTNTNVVQGNYIGTDVTGEHAIPNGTGIFAFFGINTGDQYGGTAPGAQNVISGNGTGMNLGYFNAPGFLEGNYIGTDATGTVAVGNNLGIGIYAGNAPIGGINDVAPDGTVLRTAGNLISGNGIGIRDPSGRHVEGNYIGTDVTGTRSVPNAVGIGAFEPTSNATIGGITPGARNIISGNSVGVLLNNGSGNVVEGNYVGTDVTGLHALANLGGIGLGGNATNNTIGGTSPAARNVISGNNQGDAIGIHIGDGASGNTIEGNYIGTDVTGEVAIGNGDGIILKEGSNNIVGGSAPGAGNVISGNTDRGVVLGDLAGGIHTVTQNTVQGNLIGTDATGTCALPNRVGVELHAGGGVSSNTIGGATAAARNVISGNTDWGITLVDHTNDNSVQGNFIGTDINGAALGNGGGALISYASLGNTIGGTGAGAGNVIAYSTTSGGVVIPVNNSGTAQPTGDVIRGNSIHDNAGLGIDLGSDGVTLNDSHVGQPGPNNWQNFPVLSAAYAGASTVVLGTLHSSSSSTFTLDFYANLSPDHSGYGQGQVYLGSYTTKPSDEVSPGNYSFEVPGLSPVSVGQWISATATSPTGDTSEFSHDVQVVQAVTTTSLTASANPSLLNQPVTFTATVTSPVTALGTPTGSVQFVVDGSNFGSPVSLSGSTASISTSALSVGPHTVQAKYSGDSLFVASSASLTQAVQYKFSGFLPPLNSTLAIGAGRTLPIKFQLTDFSGSFVTSLSAVVSLQVLNTQGANVLTNTGSTALRYDPASNQFVADWQTKGLPVGTYTITLALADGTTYTKTIQLTKSNSAAGLTTGANGGTGSAPGGLLGGDIALYVDNTNGDLTADELARIQDAVTMVDSLVQPYGVDIAEVTDPTQADVTVNMDTKSAVGGYADGVLGCTTDAGQITIITGWNFYAGSDPTQVGAGQYDFETVVMHELGHALGLGHSTEATSVMYATLSAGAAKRVMTTADLNVPDSDDGGPCGLHAADSHSVTPQVVKPASAEADTVATSGRRAWMALDDLAVRAAGSTHRPDWRARAAKRRAAEASPVPEPVLTGKVAAISDGLRRDALHARLVDSVLDRLDRWSIFSS